MVFGLWGQGTSKLDRLAFHLRWWSVRSVPTLMFVDEAVSPYRGQPVAVPLDRTEALAHPLKQEVLDITDNIWNCDEPIRRFLIERSLDHPP